MKRTEKYNFYILEYTHSINAEGNRWRLTGEGFLLSNSIISDLQLIQDTSIPLAKRR